MTNDSPDDIEKEIDNEIDIGETLGDLERQVFRAVRGAPASVADVASALAREARPLAYTTVMTVMTRLWEKGYLARHQEGRAYVYEARPEQEIARDLGGRAAREAIAKFGAPALTGFVETLSAEQRALVARLLEEGERE